MLVNSSLSSLPTYTMGFYRFNEEVHKKWILLDQDYGGLWVINTRVMNNCLLSKWIWKIASAQHELWFRILKAKYFPRGVFRDANTLKGPQFWKNV